MSVSGILGAVRLKKPYCTDLIGELKNEMFLFHGAGSANLGCIDLLAKEAGVPLSQMKITNSRGLIWKSEDGKTG